MNYIYKFKNYVFYCSFTFEKEITSELILRILILIHKIYPNFIINDTWVLEKKINQKWVDYVLQFKTLTDDDIMGFDLNIPFFFQDEEGKIEKKVIEEGISIYYNTEKGAPSLDFEVCANCFSNENYAWIDSEKVIVSQALAAQKNRENLKCFLKGLESLLDGEINYFDSQGYFSKEDLYAYGVKNDAKLIHH